MVVLMLQLVPFSADTTFEASREGMTDRACCGGAACLPCAVHKGGLVTVSLLAFCGARKCTPRPCIAEWCTRHASAGGTFWHHRMPIRTPSPTLPCERRTSEGRQRRRDTLIRHTFSRCLKRSICRKWHKLRIPSITVVYYYHHSRFSTALQLSS